MIFEDAYMEMRDGEAVISPVSNETWKWDHLLQSFIIEKSNGSTYDFREIENVPSLLENTFADGWVLKNQPVVNEQEMEKNWWDLIDFEPEERRFFRRGDFDDDIEIIQEKLKKKNFYEGKIDGDYGPSTEKAVRRLQTFSGLVTDGLFGEKTAAALNDHIFPGSLSQQKLDETAKKWGARVEAIMAIAMVESRGRGFFDNGQPIILFERHWMYRRMKHYGRNPTPFVTSQPNIVNTKWGGYKGGTAEHGRLKKAKDIHVASGLESASWGAFQIMCFHWERLGYDSPNHFVDCMQKNEDLQFDAFVKYVEGDSRLLEAVKSEDFTKFASIYNGPAYERNNYHIKMRNERDRLLEMHKEAA